MYSTRLRSPRIHGAVRLEQLETRLLLHYATTFADGFISIVPVHTNTTIKVEWDPTSRSIEVFVNDREELHVAGSEVRGLNLFGLAGNDVAYLDARLDLPLSYDRGGDLGVLRGQLIGYEDADYYVATPGCQEFAFVCETGEHTKPTTETVSPLDAYGAALRAIAGSHVAHLMTLSGRGGSLNGDGASTWTGNLGLAFMNHGLNAGGNSSHGAGAAADDGMATMPPVVKKIWMPPG